MSALRLQSCLEPEMWKQAFWPITLSVPPFHTHSVFVAARSNSTTNGYRQRPGECPASLTCPNTAGPPKPVKFIEPQTFPNISEAAGRKLPSNTSDPLDTSATCDELLWSRLPNDLATRWPGEFLTSCWVSAAISKGIFCWRKGSWAHGLFFQSWNIYHIISLKVSTSNFSMFIPVRRTWDSFKLLQGETCWVPPTQGYGGWAEKDRALELPWGKGKATDKTQLSSEMTTVYHHSSLSYVCIWLYMYTYSYIYIEKYKDYIRVCYQTKTKLLTSKLALCSSKAVTTCWTSLYIKLPRPGEAVATSIKKRLFPVSRYHMWSANVLQLGRWSAMVYSHPTRFYGQKRLLAPRSNDRLAMPMSKAMDGHGWTCLVLRICLRSVM